MLKTAITSKSETKYHLYNNSTSHLPENYSKPLIRVSCSSLMHPVKINMKNYYIKIYGNINELYNFAFTRE